MSVGPARLGRPLSCGSDDDRPIFQKASRRKNSSLLDHLFIWSFGTSLVRERCDHRRLSWQRHTRCSSLQKAERGDGSIPKRHEARVPHVECPPPDIHHLQPFHTINLAPGANQQHPQPHLHITHQAKLQSIQNGQHLTSLRPLRISSRTSAVLQRDPCPFVFRTRHAHVSERSHLV